MGFALRAAPLTLVIHGEPEAATTFSNLLEEKLHFKVDVPDHNEIFKLE